MLHTTCTTDRINHSTLPIHDTLPLGEVHSIFAIHSWHSTNTSLVLRCEVALARSSGDVSRAADFVFSHMDSMDDIVARHQAPSPDMSSHPYAAALRHALMNSSTLAASNPALVESILRSGPRGFGLDVASALGGVGGGLSPASSVSATARRILDTGVVMDEGAASPDGLLVVLSGSAAFGSGGEELSCVGARGSGFPSVGLASACLSSGKWYYEVELLGNGCVQVGWVDMTYRGGSSDGDGVGDCARSWAYDGYRNLRWHDGSTPYGRRWKTGDIVGCSLDLDECTISFSLNGEDLGIAFSGFSYSRGLFPAASFNRRQGLRWIFGGEHGTLSFLPDGFSPVRYVLSEHRVFKLNAYVVLITCGVHEPTTRRCTRFLVFRACMKSYECAEHKHTIKCSLILLKRVVQITKPRNFDGSKVVDCMEEERGPTHMAVVLGRWVCPRGVCCCVRVNIIGVSVCVALYISSHS